MNIFTFEQFSKKNRKNKTEKRTKNRGGKPEEKTSGRVQNVPETAKQNIMWASPLINLVLRRVRVFRLTYAMSVE